MIEQSSTSFEFKFKGASIPEYVTIIGEDAVVPSNMLPVRIPEKPPSKKQVGICIGPYHGHYDVYR